jgi:hypothetical protein
LSIRLISGRVGTPADACLADETLGETAEETLGRGRRVELHESTRARCGIALARVARMYGAHGPRPAHLDEAPPAAHHREQGVPAPGRRTLTQRHVDCRTSLPDRGAGAAALDQVAPPGEAPAEIALVAHDLTPILPQRAAAPAAQVARRSAAGAGSPLPHLDAIQRSFGSHDVSGVQAHTGSASVEACDAFGAQAYATGNDVVFRSATPDLHTAAHEAAHVVQQRGGVRLKDDLGQPGDEYERNADAVADVVVAGESAEELLGQATGSGTAVTRDTQHAVQRQNAPRATPVAKPTGLIKPATKPYVFGVGGQKVFVFVSPRGITTRPDIFVHYHGYNAHYSIEEPTKNLAGIGVVARSMANARANLVAILPKGSGIGMMPALDKMGFPRFVTKVLEELGKELRKNENLLRPGKIGVSGHSAGGYEGVQQTLTTAGRFRDSLTEVTLIDAGYSKNLWLVVKKWLLSGKPGKSLRIVAQGHQVARPWDRPGKGITSHHPVFGRAQIVRKRNLPNGWTAKHLPIVDPRRDHGTTVLQHTKIYNKQGKEHADVLILRDAAWSNGARHEAIRDDFIDDALHGTGQGTSGTDRFGRGGAVTRPPKTTSIQHGNALLSMSDGSAVDPHGRGDQLHEGDERAATRWLADAAAPSYTPGGGGAATAAGTTRHDAAPFYMVLSATARLRTDPLALRLTRDKIPPFTRVEILVEHTEGRSTFVKVAAGVGTTRRVLGWTSKSNLARYNTNQTYRSWNARHARYGAKVVRKAGADPTTFFSQFQHITFLGRPTRTPIHKLLADHLKAAESRIVAAHGRGLTPTETGTKLGLSPSIEPIDGVRPTSSLNSMHLFGLAIDLDRTNNPHVGQNAGPTIVVVREAGLLLTGRPERWATHMSTDRTLELDKLLERYFALLDDPAKLAEAVLSARRSPWKHMSPANARRRIARHLDSVSRSWGRSPRRIKSGGFTSYKKELIDGMDLYWLGAGLGDMMHFDMRETPGLGKRIAAARNTVLK